MARRRKIHSLAQLREIGDHVVTAAKEALQQGAEIIATDANNRVPVKTGKLRDSIKIHPNSAGTLYKISADAKSDSGIAYGRILEYSPKSDKAFLHPALHAHKQEIKKNVEDAVHNAINR